jgi:hypothetical protein
MINNTYHVRVIPDMNKDRFIARTIPAQNATEAAGLVLRSLGGEFVDCIEVKQPQGKGRRALSKVAFYSCLYGMVQGFLFEDRLVVAS